MPVITVCTQCKVEKPRSQFAKGCERRCKKCRNTYGERKNINDLLESQSFLLAHWQPTEFSEQLWQSHIEDGIQYVYSESSTLPK